MMLDKLIDAIEWFMQGPTTWPRTWRRFMVVTFPISFPIYWLIWLVVIVLVFVIGLCAYPASYLTKLWEK
jgi:ABC-type antimicrobial peptide transport system permease subunit